MSLSCDCCNGAIASGLKKCHSTSVHPLVTFPFHNFTFESNCVFYNQAFILYGAIIFDTYKIICYFLYMRRTITMRCPSSCKSTRVDIRVDTHLIYFISFNFFTHCCMLRIAYLACTCNQTFTYFGAILFDTYKIICYFWYLRRTITMRCPSSCKSTRVDIRVDTQSIFIFFLPHVAWLRNAYLACRHTFPCPPYFVFFVSILFILFIFPIYHHQFLPRFGPLFTLTIFSNCWLPLLFCKSNYKQFSTSRPQLQSE
jgi:hypothetical protein